MQEKRINGDKLLTYNTVLQDKKPTPKGNLYNQAGCKTQKY